MRPTLFSLSVLAICLTLASFQASAEVAESYKCKMNAGVTRAQIAEMGEMYIKLGESKNVSDFQLSILFPMYTSDMSAGTFFWNGTSPSLSRLEEAIAIWESPENSQAQTLWLKYVKDCESASLFSAIPIN